MGKAVIVSDTEPYSQWIKNGVNGIKIKESRNSIDWYMAMKKLIKEPNYRKDLAAGLKETIEEYFDMDTHNEARAELYKSLI
jgi:glycosyltransferase involved in cell wall biosynthesis